MKSFFCSTIGQKATLSITGLLLALFVLSHMAGNLLIFMGPQAYNSYSHALITNPFIYVAEAGLVVAFLVHVILALSLTRRNITARGTCYAVKPNGKKSTTLTSQTMIFHGLILLVFVPIHLWAFKYGTYYEANYNGVVMRDLYRLVIEEFQRPGFVAWYVFAMLILFLHLYHGVSSVFQSWGFNHPKYTPKLKKFGYLYAFVVAAGFAANPIFIFLNFAGGGQ